MSAAASPDEPEEEETHVDCETVDESEAEEEQQLQIHRHGHRHAEDDYFRPIKKLCMQDHQEPERAARPLTSFFIKDILNHKSPAGVLSRRSSSTPVTGAIVRPWDCCPSSVAAAAAAASVGGNASGGNRRRPRSADDDSRSEKSESDYPESPANATNSSPLDALFEMTSKAFEGLDANEKIAEGSRDHLTLFSSRSQAKKKRKSRTAFTNHQIFELEKRFLYQKYLSPADRDEIAQSLGLTNAQVITWFQNRRAKLKRDMEELKKDVDASKVILHKNILHNIQDLSVLKGKEVGILTRDVSFHLATSRTPE